MSDYKDRLQAEYREIKKYFYFSLDVLKKESKLKLISNNDVEALADPFSIDYLPATLEEFTTFQDLILDECLLREIDMINIDNFTTRLIKLAEYRIQLHGYLSSRMSSVAPNLGALIGETVAARLISHAGSLTNLAKCPASTVQILGAEKALFRALKTRGNTPKYGLLYHSSFIGRAAAKNKGRISRYLANKCAIASRIDSFIDTPTTKYGEKMKEQVEERLSFYDTGAAPRKNLDVMKEAADELKVDEPKEESKKRKQVDEEPEAVSEDTPKKKKGKKSKKTVEETPIATETPKKSKKSKKQVEESSPAPETPVTETPKKKSKKSKKKKDKQSA